MRIETLLGHWELVRMSANGWSHNEATREIEMSSPDGSPDLIGNYFFSLDKLIIRGMVGKDEMYFSFKR